MILFQIHHTVFLLPSKGRQLSSCLCLLFCLLSSAVSAQQVILQTVTKTIEKTFDYRRGMEVNIEGRKAEVEVVTWDKAEVAVTLELIAKHPERQIAEQELEYLTFKLIQEGNRIILRNTIEEDEALVASVKAKFLVSVPAECPVTLANYFGNANFQNLSKSLSIDSEFCTIGLTNIKGAIGIKTRFGDVAGENIKGDVNIEARRSNITLSSLEGKFNIEAKYGVVKIYADQSFIDLNINADRSDVYFYDTSLSAYNNALTSHNGNIVVPSLMDFKFMEQGSNIRQATFEPSSEMSGVRVAINVSFGEIRIGE